MTPPRAGGSDDVPWERFEGVAMSTGYAIRRYYDHRLSALGVNLPEATLLLYLVEFGPANQARIARALDSGRVTTALRIDRLLASGLISRAPDPADRRAWLVSVTATGRSLATDISRIDEQARQDLRRRTTREQRRAFVEVAQRIRATIEELAETEQGGGGTP